MKRTLLILLFAAILAIGQLFTLTADAADSRTVVLEVSGTTCQVCPVTVRKALERVPGVAAVKVSYDTGTATVSFNPGKTDVDALTAATANAGYPSALKQ